MNLLALDQNNPAPLRRVSLVCSSCGQSFERYKSKVRGRERNYCSRACQVADRYGDHNPKWRGGCIVTGKCEQCGGQFKRARNSCWHPGHGRFCSTACKGAWQRVYPDRRTRSREAGRRRETIQRAGQAIATHTFAEWQALLAAAKGKCAICRKRRKLERDHVIPLSKGGSDAITNIQPACKSCNCSKNNRRTHLL